MSTSCHRDVTNFILFILGDNDFHCDLEKAIKYIVDNQIEELTPEALKYFVVMGTNAFNNLRYIDNFSFTSCPHKDHTTYLNEAIHIEYLDRVPEKDGREGYIWNRRTDEVYYYGY